MKKLIVLTCLAAMLAACGGGGGSSGGGGSTPSTPPVTLSLSTVSGSASATEGSAVSLTTTANVSSGSNTVVVDLQYDPKTFASVTAVAGSTPGTYAVTATTLTDLAAGDYKGTITARLCKETACTNVYSGTSVSYAYDVSIKLSDWQTFQRNAAHTAYVRTTLDATKFTKAWEWAAPAIPGSGSSSYSISPVATVGGNVVLTYGGYFTSGNTVLALNEQTGAKAWGTVIPDLAYIGTPASDGEKVYVPTIGNTQSNHVFAFNAGSGTYLYKSIFFAQWTLPGAPVVYGDQFYTAAGTYGGQVSSHSRGNGDIAWRTSITGYATAWGGETPAVDDNFIYYHSGGTLQIYNRMTGVNIGVIEDAPDGYYGYDYNGAPVIGANQSIISFQGWNGSRKLSRYDVLAKKVLWRSAQSYISAPAYAKGFIYTAKNAPPRLDVLRESDGSIAWSWVPPIADNSFISNVIVTDNMVFVATDKGTYAVDLTTHQMVWSYPVGGNLAISPGYKLYIQATGYNITSALIAISLR